MSTAENTDIEVGEREMERDSERCFNCAIVLFG